MWHADGLIGTAIPVAEISLRQHRSESYRPGPGKNNASHAPNVGGAAEPGDMRESGVLHTRLLHTRLLSPEG